MSAPEKFDPQKVITLAEQLGAAIAKAEQLDNAARDARRLADAARTDVSNLQIAMTRAIATQLDYNTIPHVGGQMVSE